MSEFFNQYGCRLVKVNPDGDIDTGWFRLMDNEKDRAEGYQKQGFKVATIWLEAEHSDEESVTMEFENSREHPFVTGYFILEPEQTVEITLSDALKLIALSEEIDDKYRHYEEDYYEDHEDDGSDPSDDDHPFYALFYGCEVIGKVKEKFNLIE